MTTSPAEDAPGFAPADAHGAEALPPLRSVHTSNIPQILEHFGASVLVTTYQAGRLVILRNDGGVLNTHFRMFPKPMGLAVSPNRLAIGCETDVREFHNVPAVGAKLDPPGRHDACFLPRVVHSTGDVQIHEMAWGGDELWFVNTRFSCLCVRSHNYSFEPRWRPKFMTRLAPEDCCHLNGLCFVDGRPKYVTALGETDEPHGWRKNKRDGGILMDVPTREIIARGLSMPHSPRWHRDKLWVLHSGTGGLGFVDPQTGRYESVVELPGFTRGLDFLGPLAFVGLSQVRESAVFSGIKIAERPPEERACGVWVVNIETGQTLGFVRFEDAVQEIFAVQVLANARFPDVVTDNADVLRGSFILTDEALRDVPDDLRNRGNDAALR